MTAKSQVELLLDTVDWKPVGKGDVVESRDALPYATHEGVLNISGCDLRCYRLNTGQCVFEMGDLERFFGSLAGNDPKEPKAGQ